MEYSPHSELTFFFCIGCQKSGTTLLARVLDQHPSISCIWESYALWPHWTKSGIMNLESDSWKQHGFLEEDVQRWSNIWAQKPNLGIRLLSRIGLKNCQKNLMASKLRTTMTEAFTDFAQRCDATVVGDKWPFYINQLDIFLKAFPNAKLIYNVRDPRGIWNSAQRFKGRKRGNEILAEMLEKDKLIEPYQNSNNLITIRYEDLVHQSQNVSRQLYQFLGCHFSEDYMMYQRDEDPYPERWGWVPESSEQFNPYHTSKWKDKMDADEVAHVSDIASTFIQKYNYEIFSV